MTASAMGGGGGQCCGSLVNSHGVDLRCRPVSSRTRRKTLNARAQSSAHSPVQLSLVRPRPNGERRGLVHRSKQRLLSGWGRTHLHTKNKLAIQHHAAGAALLHSYAIAILPASFMLQSPVTWLLATHAPSLHFSRTAVKARLGCNKL